MNIRRLYILLLVGACLATASFADESSQDPVPPPVRIVAEYFPPYDYSVDGKAAGINVEVTSRIMKRIGVPFEYRPDYPFARAWALIRSGNADALPNVACLPERRAFVYCSPPYDGHTASGLTSSDYLWVTRYVFFVRKQYADVFTFVDYKQLKRDGLRVGVCQGYSYDRGKLLDAGLVTRTFVDPEAGLKALAAGDIDLFPLDETVGRWFLEDLHLADSITTLPRTIFEKPYEMMFSRASSYPDLENIRRRFYEELRKMRDSGEYAGIVNRYIPPGYPFPLPRPLVFVAEQWAPFEYLRDGELMGIDVDVVKRVMNRLHLPYEIQLYPWSRAWMLVQEGQADAVLSISYKPSREDVLYYTPCQRGFAETGTLPDNYLWMSQYLFFIKKSRAHALRFESFEQLKQEGIRIGTNRDYSYCPEFVAADLSCREYPDTRSGMTALINENIDMYPMDRTVGLAELKEMGLAESVTFIPKAIFSKPYLSPFVRGSDMPGLEAIMDAFYFQLRVLRLTGEYDDIVSAFQKQ